MINLEMRSNGPLDQNSISSLNKVNVRGIVNANNVETLNHPVNQSAPQNATSATGAAAVRPAPAAAAPVQQAPFVPVSTPVQQASQPQPAVAAPVDKPIPQLLHPVQKGQKVGIGTGAPLTSLKACFGWNVNNGQCDVDVSAFLLGADGKVLGDDWFVFYGQTDSPDASVVFKEDNGADRELVNIDLTRLNSNVQKIVFVLTINEAFEKNLNFSMVKDAYVRILNGSDSQELVSFKMTDYYANVISMMIGEVYLHNGAWKFNAVGNGVAKDLAGLCELYGVQVV